MVVVMMVVVMMVVVVVGGGGGGSGGVGCRWAKRFRLKEGRGGVREASVVCVVRS